MRSARMRRKGRMIMTEKDLRKLNRVELLEMMLEQGKETEALREQVASLQQQLEVRQIHLEQAGNIAEAALQINGVFDAAQAAAKQYVDNIKELSQRQEAICGEMEKKTKEKCDALLLETKKKCYQMEVDAQEGVDAKWAELSQRLERFYNEHKGLRELLSVSEIEKTYKNGTAITGE